MYNCIIKLIRWTIQKSKIIKSSLSLLFYTFTCIFLMMNFSYAQEALGGLPALSILNDSEGKTTYSLSLQILLLMSALTILPSLLLGMTAFTRIIIVMSILRQALGTQQTPPNQVLIALGLFLTAFVMAPTFTRIYDQVGVQYINGDIAAPDALSLASSEMKEFMVKNTRESDISMFAEIANSEEFDTPDDIPFTVALPAFITSELKTGFQIGFLLFLPFLVIDMIVASVLMSLGMMMLSPMLIALPFKLLLFVLVDGWSMTVGSLVSTFVSN